MRLIDHRIIGDVDYVAIWHSAAEEISIYRNGKPHLIVSNISTLEEADAYLASWFIYHVPERHAL